MFKFYIYSRVKKNIFTCVFPSFKHFNLSSRQLSFLSIDFQKYKDELFIGPNIYNIYILSGPKQLTNTWKQTKKQTFRKK